jgi:phosphoketolase
MMAMNDENINGTSATDLGSCCEGSFESWSKGHGVISHSVATQQRIKKLSELLLMQNKVTDLASFYQRLIALDIITNQAMWLVAHMTYSKNVYLDGRELRGVDFKQDPQRHTGGSLNMVPAFAGFLAANTLSGIHRDWLMGQGHCVAAIDALQLLTGQAKTDRQQQFPLSDQGLTDFVRAFYSYKVSPQGKPASSLGSHVNVNTEGASIEGGYLGFAALHYVHQPLPGEHLVAFLSDGAFEEQRGSDWAARWWRAEDTGSVCPIMIANGRRIDQRTMTAQQGDSAWFAKHLSHQGFDPITIDGRDPAAFVWAILTMEGSLADAAEKIKSGQQQYPVALPYCIAETEKGFGFPGAGTNAAHGLPLQENPLHDGAARRLFNQGTQALFNPVKTWQQAARCLVQPKKPYRASEVTVTRPEPKWQSLAKHYSPAQAMDDYFVELAEVNSKLRIRVGNPDELSSNRFGKTLELLKHRVTNPEVGIAEAINGKIITALNEEAVISACLANQQGLNLVVSYEAFAMKMLGAIRQAIIFSRHQKEAGDAAGWLSLPVVATSHVWENGKNEQSHQDPNLSESLLNEMSDMARVVFPADANSAMAVLKACYGDLGTVWNIIAAKSKLPVLLTPEQAQQLVDQGAICLRGNCNAEIQLVAIGSYQLQQVLLLSDRLTKRAQAHSVIYLLEPGRFRQPRDTWEQEVQADKQLSQSLFSDRVQQRLFFCHGHGEAVLGYCRALDLGPKKTSALGYINQGGTLDSDGMLFANKCTWAHGALRLAQQLGKADDAWLTPDELAAVLGYGDPYQVIKRPF